MHRSGKRKSTLLPKREVPRERGKYKWPVVEKNSACFRKSSGARVTKQCGRKVLGYGTRKEARTGSCWTDS